MYRTETFTVGSVGVSATLFINDIEGGVKFTSTDYCDYYMVTGYAYNNWQQRHDFSGSRIETTSCEFVARCWESSQPIVKVEVDANVYSSDGAYHYEQVAYAEQ